MLKIGLTGGIGCGKTTVTRLFAALNVPIIDADHIAHDLVQPKQPALTEIEKTFGTEFLTEEGALNREKMRDCIFTNKHAKQKLEAILHPLVYKTIQAKLAQLDTPYCIVCIPLLFETNMTHIVDRIVVVDCPVDKQLERVKKREKMATRNIQAIIDSQIDRTIRTAKANDIIDNSTTEAQLVQQVNVLHHLYISLSTL